MKLTDKLYEEVKEIWDACIQHPFVQGIGHGDLPIEKFRGYMLQDYRYLLDYAKVFALGVVKADTEEQMRFFATQVNAVLGGEMKIHKAYMKRLSITQKEIDKVQSLPENTSYTSYMLAQANQRGCLAILVTILACALSYEKIGQALAAIPGACEHPFYGEWICGYASEEYARQNQEILDMINELAAGAGANETECLKDIYVRCSEYERAFWDMAWR